MKKIEKITVGFDQEALAFEVPALHSGVLRDPRGGKVLLVPWAPTPQRILHRPKDYCIPGIWELTLEDLHPMPGRKASKSLSKDESGKNGS